MSKIKEIADIIMDILDYSSKHSIFEEESYDKGENQGNHVLYFECFSF